MKKKKNKCRTV